MMSKNNKDFREWDIKPETSVEGLDASGFPFYLWRESADNRLTFARPRYCCITPADGELYFTFFNPFEDVRGSGGLIVFFCVAALVIVAFLGAAWFVPTPPRPYQFDESPPPVLVLLGAAFWASLLGALFAGIWHVAVTLLRWLRGRFPGEGRLYTMPLRSLSGFDKVQAGEIGAMVSGEKAKTGHGLTAVSDDGSMIILTGNAWNYRSIVDTHRDLTKAFRTPRDDMLAAWSALQKQTQPKAVRAPATSAQGASAPGTSTQGVPDTL